MKEASRWGTLSDVSPIDSERILDWLVQEAVCLHRKGKELMRATRTRLLTIANLSSVVCLLFGFGAAAQNLDVKGTTTCEGNAYFYQNVGIGTTSPWRLLHVSDVSHPVTDSNSGSSAFSVGVGGGITGSGMLMAYDSSNNLSWIQSVTPGTANRNLVLQPNGAYLGIGRTPLVPLDVNGGTRASWFKVESTGQTTWQMSHTDGATDQHLTEWLEDVGPSNIFHGRFVNDAYTLADNFFSAVRNSGTYTTKYVVLGGVNGHVGINIVPTQPLHLEGNFVGSDRKLALFKNTSTANGSVALTEMATGSGDLVDVSAYDANYTGVPNYAGFGTLENYSTNGGIMLVAGGSNGIVRFLTSGGAVATNERMRIDKYGNVGIGTNAPAAMLHVNGDIQSGFGNKLTFGGWSQGGTTLWDDNSSNQRTVMVTRATGLSVVNSVNSAAAPVTASAYYSTSSIMLKSDVNDAPYGLSEVLILSPKTFRYTDDPAQVRQIGFIAEEVDPVLPETVLHDQDGHPAAIDYSKLTVALVGAIKEQQAQLKAQQDRIQKLESAMAALQALVKQPAHP